MPVNKFSDSLKPLKRKPISAEILNMITDNILAGNLKPGDKLPTEFELAESLGVGRNSVREAIKILHTLGVVEVKMGAGTFITRSMNGSILEPLILSLAFEQGTSRELVDLRKAGGLSERAAPYVLLDGKRPPHQLPLWPVWPSS